MKLDDILNNPEADRELRGRSPDFKKQVVTEEVHRQYVQDRLFEAYMQWRSSKPSESIEERYKSSLIAIKELAVVPDSKDISDFCSTERINETNSFGLGIFLSGLLNVQMTSNDIVTIRPRKWILENDLGVFLERAKLIVEGNVGSGAGRGLKGGTLIVKGDAKYDYGNSMEAGELIIKGKVKGVGLSAFKGGHAVLYGFEEGTSFSSKMEGIECKQEGGLIEIMCDVPTHVGAIGWQQKGGELRVYGNVSCDHVNYEQSGGKTHIKGDVISKGASVLIGKFKTGGETIIDGDCIETTLEGRPKQDVLVGFQQEGGLLHIKGNVHGCVAFYGYPNAEIVIEKNVLVK